MLLKMWLFLTRTAVRNTVLRFDVKVLQESVPSLQETLKADTWQQMLKLMARLSTRKDISSLRKMLVILRTKESQVSMYAHHSVVNQIVTSVHTVTVWTSVL